MVSVGSGISKNQDGLVLHGLCQSFLMVIGYRFQAVDLAQQYVGAVVHQLVVWGVLFARFVMV
jgi:hypothetical protein